MPADIDANAATAIEDEVLDHIAGVCGEVRRVLVIGDDQAGLIRQLHAQGCSVASAVTQSDEAAALRRHVGEVFRVDAGDAAWPLALDESGLFHSIVLLPTWSCPRELADLLEQLKDHLVPNGRLIWSVRHADYRAVHRNDPERFASMDEIAEIIASAGYQLNDAAFIVRSPERMDVSDNLVRAAGRYVDVHTVIAVIGIAGGDAVPVRFDDLPVPRPTGAADPVRLVAFYLPQFHPIRQNDMWWGKGFTEWTNVSKAAPLFAGHYQPHLPSDLGFYDLRLAESRREQIAMAKRHGIDAFCYYYYWFSGERILERPLDDMLNDRDSDMPFCLCWANENWTRKWDGDNSEILIAQQYLPDDDRRCIADMLPFLRDPRYLRFNGRLLILIYNPQHLRDPRETVRCWREVCASEGLGDPYLVCAQVFGNKEHLAFGFDASVEFPPHNLDCTHLNGFMKSAEPMKGWVFDYAEAAEQMLQNAYGPEPDRAGFRTVVPSWDNTARTGRNGCMLLNGVPDNYEVWLDRAIARTRQEIASGDRLVFINAWNEWAEGCHLEPDRRFGRAFLEATLRAKQGLTRLKTFSRRGLGAYASLPGWETALGLAPAADVKAPASGGGWLAALKRRFRGARRPAARD